MSLYLLKTLIACALLIAGLTAFLSMMVMMGKAEKKTDPGKLRKIHRKAGTIFFFLLLPLIILGSRFWERAGEALSTRGVFHVVLAVTLILLFWLKILIVRFFKLFLKYVPALGMAVFVLTVLVITISAGFFLLRAASPRPHKAPSATGDSRNGTVLFSSYCLSCHRPNDASAGEDSGPGLKGVMRQKNLPVSGRPSTEENIRSQLSDPYKSMPSFKSLTEQEVKDLIAYLKTL